MSVKIFINPCLLALKTTKAVHGDALEANGKASLPVTELAAKQSTSILSKHKMIKMDQVCHQIKNPNLFNENTAIFLHPH